MRIHLRLARRSSREHRVHSTQGSGGRTHRPETHRAKSKGQDDAWGGKPGAGVMDAAFSLG
eukprot:2556098-Heterocapsa_arctica.AAC.1